MKILSVFRRKPSGDGFGSSSSLWASALAVACLIASGFAVFLLQSSKAGSRDIASLPLHDVVRWSWTLMALLGVQMAYQQLRMSRLRQQLRRREALFRIVTENAADMIAFISPQGQRLYNSPAYQKVLGYTAAELAQTSALEQVHPDDRYKLLEASRQARQTGIGKQMEYRIRHKDGSWLVFESRASVIRNTKGEMDGLVIVNRDITERKRVEAELARNSLRDPLTGLPNRPIFLDRLQHCDAFSRRNPQHRYALLVIDIDNFKDVQHNHGHAAANDLRVQVSRRLQASLLPHDTIARPSSELPASDFVLSRLDGDEFVVLLEGLSAACDALRVAERLRNCLAERFVFGEARSLLTASIGIALNTVLTESAEDVLRDAHAAMVRARSLGGARCEMYDTAAHERARVRLQLESDLHSALQRHELELFYQPILHLDSGRIVSFEALVRWHHPRHGLVSPFEFLQTAEDMGLMVPIGRWVLHEACRQVRAWQQMFLSRDPLSITVNVSARQFIHQEMISDVRSAIQSSSLQPSDLHLEISETMALSDPALSGQIFDQLRHMRVGLTLDDFGVGSSSLSRLQNLPANCLKLDRTFVSTMLADPRRADFVGLIVALAHNLGMKIIAEGIETAAQWNRLRNLGCELGQGYLFSRPLSAITTQQLLAAASAQPDLLLRQKGLRSVALT